MVCYDPLDLEAGIETTKCGHKYCHGCYDDHMKIDNKCAMCRTVLKEENQQRHSSVNVNDSSTVTMNLGPITNMGSLDGGLYARVGPDRNLLSARETAIEMGWELDDGTFTNFEPLGSINGGPLHSRGSTGGVYLNIVPYEGDSVTVTSDEPVISMYNYRLEVSDSGPSGFTNLSRW
jgi:hypothetical protein